MVGWSLSWSVSWLVCWSLVGPLAAWTIGQLVCSLVSRCFGQYIRMSFSTLVGVPSVSGPVHLSVPWLAVSPLVAWSLDHLLGQSVGLPHSSSPGPSLGWLVSWLYIQLVGSLILLLVGWPLGWSVT